jgi:pimeloyl-ACP methyl ester carboxylesterase
MSWQTFRSVILSGTVCLLASAQQHVSFPTQDGGLIYGDLYPSESGTRGVVLAHGGQFNKEGWAEQAKALTEAGFQVLAIDYRGEGQSHGPGQENIYSAPLDRDVLAAVRYLRSHGAKPVSVVGASMGGGAAGDAAIAAKKGEIEGVVFLGSAPNGPADQLQCRSLFIVARDDSNGAGPRLPGIQAQYDKAPKPKDLVVVDGSAHAQFLFQTDQGPRVMQEILKFLKPK